MNINKKLISMKKLILCVWMLLTGAFHLLANPVTVTTARKVASNFITINANAFSKTSISSLKLAYTEVNANAVNCFYVFNAQNATGFVIVAADDNSSPILGYSAESNFDIKLIPVQLKELLDGYSKQITYIIANNSPATLLAKNKWQELISPNTSTVLQKGGPVTSTLTPLIQTNWNQSPYYNNLCPYDNQFSARTVTGCVATAMAQVMKYWNYPAIGTGSNSYTPATNSYLGVQSANFGNTTYDWNNMPLSVSSSSSSVQQTAVATLMYHCGVGVNMDYGVASTGGSGAYVISYNGSITYCAENALKNYFGYSSSLQGLDRSNYADAQWISLIENEISLSRPVIYTGSGSQGGHCFVADAYDTSNLFHINWGWGGYSNGFFNLNALNPATYTFNANQTALIGVKPSNVASIPTISGFTPASGSPGTTVTISGSNFAGITDVSFGGVSASSFSVVSTSSITAVVGSGASGNVTVTNSAGTASYSGFTFVPLPTLPPPTITSFSPIAGPIGTTVTIIGTNFSTTTTNNVVYFGAVRATVTAATATSLTVTVPYGATYQPITVNTNYLNALSSLPFTVTFTGGGNAFTTSTFTSKIDYTTNPSPGQTTIADLDGDGKADITVANGSTSNSLSIFRNISNKGSITLSNRADITTTGSPYGLNYADLDGDGKPDITFTNYSTGNFGVFRNKSSIGNISLASEIDFTSGTNPASTAFGDFDGDGKLDIVVGNVGSNSISVYRNLSTIGSISFTAKTDYTTGSSPFVAAVADLDGDGKPDIVVSVQGSPIVTVFRNTSSGTGNISFSNVGNFTAGSGPRYVSVTDIDGDGKLDLVVCNSSVATVSILRNTSSTGNISFATKVDFSTGSSTVPTQTSIADFDGDGKPDFVVAEESPANVVSVFRNISTVGNISFNTTVNYATNVNPYGVSTGDIDGDGKPDIIVANGSSSNISIFRNQQGEPVISSITPTAQSSGGQVIISGSNFTGATAVSFGGVAATSFTVVSSTAIIATVGNGASGNVSVTIPSGTAVLPGFSFIAPIPTITSFSPTSGAIGTTVTITGTNFSATPASNTVFFGAVKATVSAASTTSLTVTVPYGATYLPITVTTNNLIAASAKPFIVNFAGGGIAFSAGTLSSKVDYATNSTNNTPGIADLDGDGKADMIIITEGSNTIAVYRNTSAVRNISFATRQDINTSAFPLGGTFTDLDGDGKPDIAFISHTTNNIGIIRNTSTGIGNISFSSEVDYATGTNPYYIAVGDLDGDGKPDLAVCNASSSNTISVFLNQSTPGNISFAAQSTFSVGNTPFGITIGDFDGDGKLDIATANAYGNSISLLRNTSTGIGNLSFVRGSDYATGTQPYSVTIGDLDGDGKPEIIAGISTGSGVTVFRNTSVSGSISFSAGVNYATGTSANNTYLSITDIDGDGKPDICAADGGLTGTNKSIALLRNLSSSGNLAFDAAVNYTTGTNNAFNTVLGDFDGDGKPDIVVANNNSGNVSVFRNQVGEPVVTAFTPTSAAAGASVIISGTNFTGATAVSFGGVAATSFTVVSSTAIIATVGNGATGNVSVTTPNGTGSLGGFYFNYPVPTITSFTPTAGAIGTTVTITGTNFNTIPLNNIVYFGAIKATVTASTATSITVTVPAGASYLPITVTTNGLTAASVKSFDVTFPGGGATLTAALYSAHQDYSIGTAPQSILLGDFDNDGKADYVYVNTVSTGLVTVYRNTGSGKTLAFTATSGINTGQYPCSVVVVDIDGDGKLDLVVTNLSSNSVTVLRNTSVIGNISFATGVNYTTGNGPEYFAVGDIDGDGRPDLVIGAANANTMAVFLNNGSRGNISFAAGVNYSVGTAPTSVALADLNNDGKLDIAVSNYNTPTVSIYINRSTQGSLAFDGRVDFATTTGAYNIDIHDMDGDGKPDLIVPNNSNSGSTVSVFRNINTTVGGTFSAASFASKIDYTVGSAPAGLSIADVDGDGKPDIATANRSSNTISILRNTSSSGNLSFDTKVDYPTATDPRSVVLGDVDNDGKPDILSANPTSNTASILRNQLGEPSITSFTPTSAAAGASVIISGANLTGTTAVSFGGVAAASFTVVSSTAILATVGNGATGAVAITNPNGNASLAGFTFIIPVPTITSFSPTAGAIGTTVVITGTNFNSTSANNIVYFGTVKAIVSAATSTSLTVTVPYGTGYQPITVTTNGLTAYSTKSFNVTFPGGGTAFNSNYFATATNFTNGQDGEAIAVADIDGDGKPDVLSGKGSPTLTYNTLSVFRNTSTKGKPGFAANVDYTTANAPAGIALGDFDGDGKLDVVDVNYSSGVSSTTGSVFKNNSTVGNISLGSRVDLSLGNSFSVVVGDFDGDGKPDIAASNMTSNTISFFKNTSANGIISFAARVDFSIGSQPISIAAGDIDGDGKLDICSVNQNGNTFSVILNTSTNGTISFAARTYYTTGSSPRGIAIGDLDGDGKLDVAIGNSGAATISVFRNLSTTGSASFSTKQDYNISTTPVTLSISDMDGDGKPDVAAACAGGNFVSIIRNNCSVGSLLFDNGVNYTATSTYNLTLNDLDGDGKPDIISGTGANTFSVLRNQIGEPTITSFTPTSAASGASVIISGTNFTGTTSVTFGGVAAASFTVVSSTAIIATVGSGASGDVSVITPNGTASLSGFNLIVPVPTITSFAPASGAIGTTVTITGKNFSSTAANNAVYFGAAKAIVSAATTTSLTVTVPLGATYQPITVTTNNLSAFSANPFVVTFAGGGIAFTASTFKTKIDFKADSGSNSLASTDFDGDGKIDLIVTNSSANSLSILRNISTLGNISFAAKTNFTTSGRPWGVCVFDFDGDGKADIAAPNYSNNTVAIFRNTSTPGVISLSTEIDYATGSSPNFVTVNDFDGDGKPDIVVANSYSATVSVYLNTSTPGNISFGAKIDFNVGGHPNVITIADIDGDGKADIISANQTSNSISVLRNISTGVGNINFATQATFASGGTPYPIAVGDIDGDGKLDIVTGNANVATVSVFKNNSTVGSVSFATHVDYSTGSGTVPIAMAITDLDGDGKLDISVAGASPTNVVSNLRNLSTSGNINFDPTVNYATGSAPYSVVIGDLDGDGKPDIAVANANSSSVSVLRNQTGEPVITSFTPTSQSNGQSVIISGANFTGATAVSFGGVAAASFSVVSSTAIIATVGYGATGSVSVTTPSGTASLAGFTYTGVLLPSISSFFPSNGTTGSVITISGTNFTGTSNVSFGGVSASSFTVINATTISAVVANGASGNVSVTTGAGTGSASGFIFCAPPTTYNSSYSGCNSVTYKGNTYTNSTIVRDTIKSITGCDSAFNVATIKVYKVTASINSIRLNGCNSLLYKGTTYTSSTIIRDTVKSTQGGCDSIYNVTEINIIKITATTNNINLSGCNSILYKGNTYLNSAIVTDTIKNGGGCDSVYNIANLTVYKITATNNNVFLNGCNSVVYKGKTYTNTTIVRDTVKSINGCDSIYNIGNITVYKVTATTKNTNLSGCNSLVYKGNTYTNSTVVRDTVKSTLGGCDSIYNVATLTIYKLNAVTYNYSSSGCNLIYYNGTPYTTTTIIRDTVKSIKGCDSVYNVTTLNITKIVPVVRNTYYTGCDSFTYRGIVYKNSTTVTDTTWSYYGCDSVHNVANITVTPTPLITVSSNTPVAIGDTIKLYATSSVGNIYQWTGPLSYSAAVQNPTITPATVAMSGTYKVTVNNNSCIASANVSVTVSTIYAVSGSVKHPKGYYIKDIVLNGTGSSSSSTTTNAAGNYSINFSSGGNYTVTPFNFGRGTFAERDKDRREVTTLDIALIQSHILQKNLLNSPYKIIAADVNNDGKVSTLDIVFMKRLILGIDTAFTGNKQWAFVDSSFIFADLTNPFPHKDSIRYNNLSANQSNQSYIGFILGDVNWSATAGRSMYGISVTMQYNELSSENGNLIHVPVTVKNFTNLMGIQYTLNYNNEAVEFVGLTKNTIGLEYAKHADGKLSFLWNDVNNETRTLEDGTILFEMVFKPRKTVHGESILISSDITNIEALDGNFNTHDITLEKVSNSLDVINKELWVITPNPTEGMIKINMVVKETKSIVLQLTDAVGKTYFSTKVEALKGSNNFALNLKAQSKLVSGVYYLKADNLEVEKVKQILVR